MAGFRKRPLLQTRQMAIAKVCNEGSEAGDDGYQQKVQSLTSDAQEDGGHNPKAPSFPVVEVQDLRHSTTDGIP